MKFFKYMGVTILSIIIAIFGFIYYLKIQRDIKTWEEYIEITEGNSISINIKNSKRKVYGGHGLGLGGGDYKNSIQFKYRDIKYFHESPYTLLCIRVYKENFYLVYYDRETYSVKTTYKFYKSTKKGSFEEIQSSKFPKHIAIQNRWFNGDNNFEKLKGLDPNKMVESLTSEIWYMIEGKQKIFDYKNNPATVDFVKKYKEKYITNRTEE